MGYSSRYILFLISVILVLVQVGCVLIPNLSKLDGQEAFEATIAERDAIQADIEQYLGRHKEELRMLLGEPSEIISPSQWNNVKYDEEWVYSKGISFVTKQYRMFYIKEGIVVHVEFGGVF